MNVTPLFWLTTESAMLLSTYIAHGKDFRPEPAHNLNRLMATATKRIATLLYGFAGLEGERRAFRLTMPIVTFADAHEPSEDVFRSFWKEIEENWKLYNARYREVRNKVFAHNVVADLAGANSLLEGTTVTETKALFAFLDALDQALWQLFLNGRKPTLEIRPFLLPPPKTRARVYRPGEKIYQGINAILQQITFGRTPRERKTARPAPPNP